MKVKYCSSLIVMVLFLGVQCSILNKNDKKNDIENALLVTGLVPLYKSTDQSSSEQSSTEQSSFEQTSSEQSSTEQSSSGQSSSEQSSTEQSSSGQSSSEQLPITCLLNGEIFLGIGSVNCLNNEAIGTGTLLSTRSKGAIKVELTGTLFGNDSEIKFTALANSSLIGPGFRFKRNEAFAIYFDGDGNEYTQNMNDPEQPFFNPLVNTPFTYCLDIHVHGSTPHIVAISTRCPRPDDEDVPGADYDNPVAGVKKGERWGIKLRNAKVSIAIKEGGLGH